MRAATTATHRIPVDLASIGGVISADRGWPVPLCDNGAGTVAWRRSDRTLPVAKSKSDAVAVGGVGA